MLAVSLQFLFLIGDSFFSTTSFTGDDVLASFVSGVLTFTIFFFLTSEAGVFFLSLGPGLGLGVVDSSLSSAELKM